MFRHCRTCGEMTLHVQRRSNWYCKICNTKYLHIMERGDEYDIRDSDAEEMSWGYKEFL